jgi:hypothetical protein
MTTTKAYRRFLLATLIAVGASACASPLEPAPSTAQNIVCPTGCVPPPGCHVAVGLTGWPSMVCP